MSALTMNESISSNRYERSKTLEHDETYLSLLSGGKNNGADGSSVKTQTLSPFTTLESTYENSAIAEPVIVEPVIERPVPESPITRTHMPEPEVFNPIPDSFGCLASDLEISEPEPIQRRPVQNFSRTESPVSRPVTGPIRIGSEMVIQF